MNPSPHTLELLLRRRSVLAIKHSPPGPSPDELDTLLRCATRVPDHGKLTPWRIRVYQGDSRITLGQALAQIYQQENPDASERQIDFQRQRPCHAPLLLIVSSCITQTEQIPRLEQVLSGGALCHTLLIAATALGYASQWLSEWPSQSPGVKQYLGIAEQDDILGMIYIGHCDETPQDRPRPTLEEVVQHC